MGAASVLIIALTIWIQNSNGQVNPLDSGMFRDQFRFLKMLGLNLAGRSSNSPRNLRIYRNLDVSIDLYIKYYSLLIYYF